MIVYKAKNINGNLAFKKWYKMRSSNKLKRLDLHMQKIRKKWWHFRTRWTETS